MVRKNRFSTLDLQLEAIADVLALAQQEQSPERQGQLLLLVERAFAAYHEEHKAMLARRLRVIKGGSVVAALSLPLLWLRRAWLGHRAVTAGVAAATIGTCALLLTARPGGINAEPPPPAAPTVTAPPSQTPPTRSPTPTPSSPGPAPASNDPGSAPAASPAFPEPVDATTEPPIGAPPEPGETGNSQPPGSGDGGPSIPPTEPDQPGRPGYHRCLVVAHVPFVRIELGSLLCVWPRGASPLSHQLSAATTQQSSGSEMGVDLDSQPCSKVLERSSRYLDRREETQVNETAVV